MPIGISTASLYPAETSEALKFISKAGVTCAEVFVNTSSELEREYLLRLRQTADAGGVSISAVHPFTSAFESFMLFSAYKTRFLDMREYYRKYYQAANILGAKTVVIHGDRNTGAVSDDEYFERYAALAEDGGACGVTVAQENVFMHRSAAPDFISKMQRQIKNAKFVLDIKQAVRSGYNPFDVLDAMGGNVVHVHLSDNIQQGEHGKILSRQTDKDCLLPGNGIFDFERLFKKLRSYSYNGDCVIEVYRNAYCSEDEIRISARSLQRLSE